ncbi:hypothetical protein FOB58_002608 [Candida parapsilosis]|uniref:Uncharacterized protein n=1 Tax=Candida parapsilosis TaxID=5480 RepID=A0A8X7NLU6_CANPA|nr:hypothetical protein FOB59_005174 [Candida parapsilosis]KAF6049331.1 hypothetical protein FOB58_002608 [Candida parapsilosis]KAF6057182.1 hypothetical protein FOB60_001737 [Candida parapsilosis]KAF6066099.1 hypothetical protein FOB61_002169 [Candida parapsilosis]KAI5904523.1 hypothetical protein K4G60_g3681 [Candida parapsilosis]
MSVNPRFKLFRGYTSSGQATHLNSQPQQQQQLHHDTTPQSAKSQNTKNKNKNNTQFEATSSILSDYDDLEVIDEVNEESSYVLFNPVSKPKNESDILSLTNTSNGESEADTDQEYIAEEVQELRPQQKEEENKKEEEEEEEDVQTDTEKLSYKINSWYNSNIVTSNQEIDENVASWNLDEDEELTSSNLSQQQQQPQQQPQQLQPEQQSLDESKRLLTEFYGDDLFKYLDQEDIAKVKGFHNMMDVKRFLLEKDVAPTDSLLKQIIYKILYVKDKSPNFIDTSQHTFNIGNTNYINYLMEDVHQKQQQQPLSFGGSFLAAPSTFSDTNTGGGSSLIMCGGVGFGDKTSWNDI